LSRPSRASRTAIRAAIQALAGPTPTTTSIARNRLEVGAGALVAAARVAPRAVGALEVAAVRRALDQAGALLKHARSDAGAGRNARARANAQTALGLVTAAMQEFGIPLEREFSAFAVDRDFRNKSGFANDAGFTATASDEVREVVIGAADRDGERRRAGRSGRDRRRLLITQMSVYVIRDPIGRFTSNWCQLANGLITCRLNPTLRPTYSYTIAFGPKLESGTPVLVKFRTRDGRRSYSVLTTR
jgi:hypothetical protein